jgi:hypothetical protein
MGTDFMRRHMQVHGYVLYDLFHEKIALWIAGTTESRIGVGIRANGRNAERFD